MKSDRLDDRGKNRTEMEIIRDEKRRGGEGNKGIKRENAEEGEEAEEDG